jgi:hypothetical protein
MIGSLKLRKQLLVVSILALLGTITAAQIPSFGADKFQAPPDPRWASITAHDVDDAFRLLLENHPGAAPSLHDVAFQHRLAEAHMRALARARTVTSYPGYIW